MSTVKSVWQPSALDTGDVWQMSDDEMPALAFAVQDSRKRTILEAFVFVLGSRKLALSCATKDDQTAMASTG